MSKKITSLAIAIVSALGMVIMPKMSRLFAENKIDDFKAIIYKSFGFVNFFAIPMTIGIIGIANNFSQAFLADRFDGISPILIIASLLIILIGWSNVLGTQVLLPMRQDKQFIFSTILGAVLNIVINLILISNFQSLGAIISCVLSEVAVTAVQFYFLRDVLEAKKIFKTIIKPFIASSIMFVVLIILGLTINITLILGIVEIIIASIIYILIMYILKDKFLMEVINTVKNKILNRGNINEA